MDSRRGVTLVELLVVLTIAALVGSLAVPIYSRFLAQNAVSATGDKIIQNIRKAQFYAMMSRKSSSTGWGVRYSSPTLTLYQGSSYGARTATWDESYTVNSTVSITGLSDINFSRVTGVPASGITITVSQGTNSDTITVNSQGMITR